MELTYRAATRMMIDALKKCIKLHESQRYAELDAVYQALDATLPRGDGPATLPLNVALDFLDGWVDDKNHAWQMYDGIEKDDWPKLARGLIKDLKADQGISNELILEHFALSQRRIVTTIIEILFGIGVVAIFGPYVLFQQFLQFLRRIFAKKQ